MSELTSKILESGLIDEATANLMVKWGVLDDSALDVLAKNKLQSAGREELLKFAESVEAELEKARKLRETTLDLNQLKWPIQVDIFDNNQPSVKLASSVQVLVDRMGRYYFRPLDMATMPPLVPGYWISVANKSDPQHDLYTGTTREQILEVTELYIGDQVAAIQVSTK